jgi:hypothetical protein
MMRETQTELLIKELISGLERAKIAQRKLAIGIQSKQMADLRNAIVIATSLAGEIRAREIAVSRLFEE